MIKHDLAFPHGCNRVWQSIFILRWWYCSAFYSSHNDILYTLIYLQWSVIKNDSPWMIGSLYTTAVVNLTISQIPHRQSTATWFLVGNAVYKSTTQMPAPVTRAQTRMVARYNDIISIDKLRQNLGQHYFTTCVDLYLLRNEMLHWIDNKHDKYIAFSLIASPHIITVATQTNTIEMTFERSTVNTELESGQVQCYFSVVELTVILWSLIKL